MTASFQPARSRTPGRNRGLPGLLLVSLLTGCNVMSTGRESALSLLVPDSRSPDSDATLESDDRQTVGESGDRPGIRRVSGLQDEQVIAPLPRSGHTGPVGAGIPAVSMAVYESASATATEDGGALPEIQPTAAERSMTDQLLKRVVEHEESQGDATDALLRAVDRADADFNGVDGDGMDGSQTPFLQRLLRNGAEESAADPDVASGVAAGSVDMRRSADQSEGLLKDSESAAEFPAGTGDAALETEDSVLNRFRQFYVPSLEENTDRLRRQVKRFSDPFGLLREKPAETSAGGGPTAEQLANQYPMEFSEELDRGLPMQPLFDPKAEQSLQGLLQLATENLRNGLQEWPRDTAGQPLNIEEWRKRQTDLSLLYAVSGQTAESIRTLPDLPRAEQEFWQSLILATHQYRGVSDGADQPEQVSQTLAYLRQATGHLQPLAKLQVYRLQFCSRVDGFGMLTPLPTVEFEPGQRMLLYAGVRDFAAELTVEGFHRSEFAAEIVFARESDGGIVDTIRLAGIEDRCDEKRTDFFQTFELTAPLLEGGYVVKLHLKDLISNQVASSSVRMMVR